MKLYSIQEPSESMSVAKHLQ